MPANLKYLDSSMQFPTAQLLISGIFVVLGGGFNFGFQAAIINPMGEPLQEFLTQSFERLCDLSYNTFFLIE